MFCILNNRTLWFIFFNSYVHCILAVHEETLDGYLYTAYIDQQVKWIDANLACVANNSQLLYIDTFTELELLTRFIRNLGILDKSQNRFWTSGRDINRTGHYIWEPNGKTIPSTMWAANEPNNHGGTENCVELYTYPTLSLNNHGCSIENCYICKRIVEKTSLKEENQTNKDTPSHDGTNNGQNHSLNSFYALLIVVSLTMSNPISNSWC